MANKRFKYLVMWNWYDDIMVQKVFTNVHKAMQYRDKLQKQETNKYTYYSVEVEDYSRNIVVGEVNEVFA